MVGSNLASSATPFSCVVLLGFTVAHTDFLRSEAVSSGDQRVTNRRMSLGLVIYMTEKDPVRAVYGHIERTIEI